MEALAEPTLLVDEKITRRNINRMLGRARDNGLRLKPHVKTHQSHRVGRWMLDSGVEAITVSSLKMAQYFADDGWDDITIAFPCNPRTAPKLNQLAQRVKLSILISHTRALDHLNDRLTAPMQVYIEIDTGAGRTGMRPSQEKDIQSLVSQLQASENLQFVGFYSHPGHSYQCRDREEIQAVHDSARNSMQSLKQAFQQQFPDIKICMGDTPCCSQATNFEGIDEISPGNFAFYDLMQVQIGACREEDIAVALACPVVATYPKRQEMVVHAGAVHLSKESLQIDGERCFGKAVRLNDHGSWEIPKTKNQVTSISQEHGVIKCSPSFFESVHTGDVIGILPVHSCLTADAMQGYQATQTLTEVDHLRGN